jgi:hypothetical protein
MERERVGVGYGVGIRIARRGPVNNRPADILRIPIERVVGQRIIATLLNGRVVLVVVGSRGGILDP